MSEENLETQVTDETQEPQDTRDFVREQLDKLESEQPTEAPTDAPTEAPAEVATEAPSEATPEAPVQRNPFSSWKKEAQEVLTKLDPTVQQMIQERESQFHKGLEQYKGAANAYKSIAPVIEQNKEYLDYLKVTPEHAFSKLLETERLLRTGEPEQKHQMFLKMAHDYGIDLAALQNTPFNPESHKLQSELSYVRQQMAELAQARQQAEQAQLNQTIQGFAQQHEYFEDVRETMADLLDRGLANDLEDAYTKAVRLNDDVFNRVQSKQTPSVQSNVTQLNQAAKAAKAAAVSVKGAPTGVTRAPEPKSTEDAVRQAMAAHGLL